MKLSVSSAIAAALMGMFSAANADVLLQSFAGDSGWEVKTDDVITGGESTGTLVPAGDRSYFDGFVNFQPFIGGPGFAKAIGTKSFPNIDGCEAIEITMDSVIGYNGYYIAFGYTRPTPEKPIPFEWRAAIPISGSGKHANTIPLTEFSNAWDFTTGKIITTCSADPTVCPTPAVLSDIQFMEVWAQGVEGQYVTDLFSIKAVGC